MRNAKEREAWLRAWTHARVDEPSDPDSLWRWLQGEIDAFVSHPRRSFADISDFAERVFLAGVAAGISTAVDQMKPGAKA